MHLLFHAEDTLTASLLYQLTYIGYQILWTNKDDLKGLADIDYLAW